MYGHTSLDNLHVHVHVLITGHNYYIVYCWPTAYTVGLLPIQLAFSPYRWPSPYTVGLLPIQLAFSLHCFTRNEMEPFPGKKVTRKKRVKETEMLEIICTCRSIEDDNMVECEVCKEWFHQGF